MTERYTSILLFGAPGVGKGTQGKILAQIPGFRHIATGDMFRGLDPQSELGRRVTSYSSKGQLVPDELTIELWQEHMRGLVAQGEYDPASELLVLDGIPRNLFQAETLDHHVEVLRVIHLVVPSVDEMVERMKKRAEREGRRDDADEGVVRHRFDVYLEETRPVLSHYPEHLNRKVDAIGAPVEVLHRILSEVITIFSGQFANPLE